MEIEIGGRKIGDGHPCYVIAEIGINHNGSVDVARKLIAAADTAGCQAVKFQKRTVDVVYSREELDKPRSSPFGETNGDLKHGLELGRDAYMDIAHQCRWHDLHWFASCWDEASVDFLEFHDPPAYKIASASLTDRSLLEYTCSKGKPIILSTGMSTLEEIDEAVSVVETHGNQLAVLHCTSTYPAATGELNLRCIPMLRERYGVPVGYSGHEVGLQTTLAAVTLGACIVERHITLDRSMFGSDQAASVEPNAMWRLVRDIRAIEQAMGDGVKRVYESEVPVMRKLRRVGV